MTTETQAQAAYATPGRVRARGPDRGRADVLDLIHADHARIRRLLATAESAARRAEPARAPRMLSEAWDRAAVLLQADCDAEEEICCPAWWRAVTAAITATREHFTHEEHGALAQIRHRTSPAQRRTLGRQWAAYMNARARDAGTGAGEAAGG
jgi:hypothetical protein